MTDRCADCGFDPHDVGDHELADAMRAMGDRWVVFVDAITRRDDGDAVLHARPAPDRPSALEHEQHLVERLHDLRLAMGRAVEAPTPVAPDDAIVELTDEQDPDVVLGRITAQTDEMATLLRGSPPARVAADARVALHQGYHRLAVAERTVQALLDR